MSNVTLSQDRQRGAADHPNRPRFGWLRNTATPRGSASAFHRSSFNHLKQRIGCTGHLCRFDPTPEIQ
jgi:hypothetical protein